MGERLRDTAYKLPDSSHNIPVWFESPTRRFCFLPTNKTIRLLRAGKFCSFDSVEQEVREFRLGCVKTLETWFLEHREPEGQKNQQWFEKVAAKFCPSCEKGGW